MTDWIFDRQPTSADADGDGDVVVLVNKGDDEDILFDWAYMYYGDVFIGQWWIPAAHRMWCDLIPPFPLASTWLQSQPPVVADLTADEAWSRAAELASSIGATLRSRSVQGVAERTEELLALVRSIGQEVTQ